MNIYIVLKTLTRTNGEKVMTIYDAAFVDEGQANAVKKQAEESLPRYKIYDVEVKELELLDKVQWEQACQSAKS